MNFYYRSLPDGQREVVCTRCFLTVGAAWEIDEIRRIENTHQCRAVRASAAAPQPPVNPGPRVPPQLQALRAAVEPRLKSHLARNFLLVFAAALLLYLVPTLFEFTALRSWNPWIAVVIPGDLAGCLCLAVVFRKVRAGIALYFLLTAIEAGCYWFQIMSPGVLLWVTDLVPTLMVSAIIWCSAGRSAKLIAIS